MDYVSFCSYPVISFSRPAFNLPTIQVSAYQVHEQLLLGWALAPECCISVKARLMGKFLRIDLDKENLAFVALRVYICIKMQFLSEI